MQPNRLIFLAIASGATFFRVSQRQRLLLRWSGRCVRNPMLQLQPTMLAAFEVYWTMITTEYRARQEHSTVAARQRRAATVRKNSVIRRS